ncbi:hypothetical protein F5878DRAFT_710421 [Lentinula raphanica]|uniref:Aminoglycoside phosphotransferase domain-containing protein n=1 Tax=Lentinula raphanica TaxID=153919 RepID=A0AA38P8F6_9AGAR|nr:hypothetical protein F5878DRAFT_710421 [Lentinula raphanica]
MLLVSFLLVVTTHFLQSESPALVCAAPLPAISVPPPPYSHEPPSQPMTPSSPPHVPPSGHSESPPPSYSSDLVYRVLREQNFTRAWMSSPGNSKICTAPNPHNKKAELTVKVLHQLDRSALSEVKALGHLSSLFDSGLLKGKPAVITRKSPGVTLQETDAWIKDPGQRDNLKEQVRAKVRAQVLLWATGNKLLYVDLHWDNFLVEMTKDGTVKTVHIVNFVYPLLVINLLSPYTTKNDLFMWV